MLVIVMAISVLLLLAIVWYQYQTRRTLLRDIQYVTDKLHEIVTDRSAQKLLRQTGTQALRDLLTGINLMQ
jgi:low affinity Fe/Cu permease